MDGSLQELEVQEICVEIVSLSNVRGYTTKVSPTWLPKYEQNRDHTNGYAKVDRENSIRLQNISITGKYRNLEQEIAFLKQEHGNRMSTSKNVSHCMYEYIDVNLYKLI